METKKHRYLMNKMEYVTRKTKFKGYGEDSINVDRESVLAHPERVSALISQNGNAYEEGRGDAWDPIRVLGGFKGSEPRGCARRCAADKRRTRRRC
ncbi:hypothetical protein [Paraburkholderia edwinii]|jgi:hypothetical protein|uniref:hypothetical protein n=1 Tax=Paraburkholderia edwinii TaxID=2861782 RepID=UPI003CCE749C